MSVLPAVGIDARPLQERFKSHHGRGIGRYVRSLVDAMLPFDREERLRLLVDGDAELPAELRPRATRVDSPPWLDRVGPDAVHLRQHLFWPRSLSRCSLDLVHFGSQTDAPALFVPGAVITVLDLIPHRMESLYRAGKSRLRYATGRWLERRALRQARGLLAISEYTRRDVLSLLDVPEDRVRVTPLGVDPSFAPVEAGAVDALCRERQLSRGYLLYVGGIDRRKNVPFLLEVVRDLLFDRPGTELVLAGNLVNDPDYPALVARIRALGLERAVRLVGYVPDRELAALYAGAAAFAFPSLYEGFGLPPLEAMACGTPVVAANRTSLPEVLGDAALLVDPTDGRSFRDAIRTVLEDTDKAAVLRERGLRRARTFSWQNTARATLEAYRYFGQNKKDPP